MTDQEIHEAQAIAADLEARLREGTRHGMTLGHTGHQVALLLPYLRHLEALRTALPTVPAAASVAEVAADLREATTGAAKVWLLYNESDEVVGAYADEAAATAAIEYDRSFLAWPSPADSYTVREIEIESGKGGADAAR